MPSLRQRARYRFDNWMSRGVGAQILLLAALTAVLLTLTVIAIKLYGGPPAQGDDNNFHQNPDEGLGALFLRALEHAIDPGSIGNDPWTWWIFLSIMLVDTIGGLFIVSTLIGVINNGVGNLIDSLRRGRSAVIERGHTVILGFSPKIHTILKELATAGANQKDPCVVVLADRDKIAMDDELAPTIAHTNLRVVTRSGNPMSLADLRLAHLEGSKAVIVLAPPVDGTADAAAREADTIALKSLLALSKVCEEQSLHVVAELQDEKTEPVARMVLPHAALVVSPPLISRLLVQTGRQSGLSIVYSELLDFAGCEIYVQAVPGVAGKSFRDAVFAFDSSTVIGIVGADDEIVLRPKADRVIRPDDRLIVISDDDDTIVLDGRPVAIAADMEVPPPRQRTRRAERTLVIGASPRLPSVLRELEQYVAPGSETLVVGHGETMAAAETLTAALEHMQVIRREGDITDRALLDALDVTGFDHILVLSETEGRDQEMADARTMITLLHLRDILRKSGKHVSITSEILEIENRDLAAVAEADDFIVSNTLVSLLVSQISENRHLVRIFDELFSAGGSELYLKPAEEYVPPGRDVPYQAMVDAALARGELAIGVRVAARARDPEASFGVVVNPRKSQTMRIAPGDKVIVVADD